MALNLILILIFGFSLESFGAKNLQCGPALSFNESELEARIIAVAKAHTQSTFNIPILKILNFLRGPEFSLNEEEVIHFMARHEFLNGYAPLASQLVNWSIVTMGPVWRGLRSLQGVLTTSRGEEVIFSFGAANAKFSIPRKDSIEIRSAHEESSEVGGYSNLRRFLAAGILISRAHGGLGWVALGIRKISSIDASPILEILPGPFLGEITELYSKGSETLETNPMSISMAEVEKLLQLLTASGSVAKEIAKRSKNSGASIRTKLEGFLKGEMDSEDSMGSSFVFQIQN